MTAFQSAQKDSSILSPRSSTSLDSPMARALAASAAGSLAPAEHLMYMYLALACGDLLCYGHLQTKAGDLDITWQALQLVGLLGQRVWMLCTTGILLRSGGMQMPGGRRQRAGSG